LAVDGVELGQMARMQCQVALAPINSVGELDEALCIGEAVKAGVVLLEKGVVGNHCARSHCVDHARRGQRLAWVQDRAEAKQDDVEALIVGRVRTRARGDDAAAHGGCCLKALRTIDAEHERHLDGAVRRLARPVQHAGGRSLNFDSFAGK